MPAQSSIHEELLSDDDQSWRRHILWQSAALAPNAAADLELNKAVEEVGDSCHHFVDLLPMHMRWLFHVYCIASASVMGVVFIFATRSSLMATEVDAWMLQGIRSLCIFAAAALACEIALLLVLAAGLKAIAFRRDHWFALDLIVLLVAAWVTLASPRNFAFVEACISILALRFALQIYRVSTSANATADKCEKSARVLRSMPQVGGGITLDTDLGFDNTSCNSELRCHRTFEAQQDSGFESASCCSTSELKAERELEAKQAAELDFDEADRPFEFDDIEAGWVCVSCGTLNVGEDPQDRRTCEYCEASPANSFDAPAGV